MSRTRRTGGKQRDQQAGASKRLHSPLLSFPLRLVTATEGECGAAVPTLVGLGWDSV